jgi:hypothetical protein
MIKLCLNDYNDLKICFVGFSPMDRQLLIIEKPRQTVMTAIIGVKAIVDS